MANTAQRKTSCQELRMEPGSSSERAHFSSIVSALPASLLAELCASASICKVALETTGVF